MCNQLRGEEKIFAYYVWVNYLKRCAVLYEYLKIRVFKKTALFWTVF